MEKDRRDYLEEDEYHEEMDAMKAKVDKEVRVETERFEKLRSWKEKLENINLQI